MPEKRSNPKQNTCTPVRKIPRDGAGMAAAIDIGTNSVLLLLGRCRRDHLPEEVKECFRTTRLGEGLSRTNRLRPQAVARTLNAVAEYLEMLPRAAPDGGIGVACATCAVREAADPAVFIEPCERLLGGPLLLASGDEEARFSFQGACADLVPGASVVVVDVGGGSTELAFGIAGAAPSRTFSLPLGCVRLAERFGLDDAVDAAGIDAARRAVEEVLGTLAGIPAVDLDTCVAVGGTATTYAAVRQHLVPYDSRRVHGFEDEPGTLAEWAVRLARAPLDERQRLPGMPEDRAGILPAGLLILDAILRFFGVRRFRVSARGLRFGLLMELCRGNLVPSFRW